MKKYYVSFECGETNNTYWDGLYLRNRTCNEMYCECQNRDGNEVELCAKYEYWYLEREDILEYLTDDELDTMIKDCYTPDSLRKKIKDIENEIEKLYEEIGELDKRMYRQGGVGDEEWEKLNHLEYEKHRRIEELESEIDSLLRDCIDEDKWEKESYHELKEEIIEQAKEENVDIDELEFEQL